jgi:ubiquinone/menaquinone biosynthesis C-methylase UbiE
MPSKYSDFDRISSWYDNCLNQIYFRAIYARAEKMAEPCLANGGKVLDIGCGTGNWLVRLAKKYKKFELHGIDRSQGMLAVAAKKNQNIELKTGLAEKLPYNDGEFDFVFMIEALHHFDDQAQSLREASRVLKPGGCLFLIDPSLNGWSGLFWRSAKILPFERTSRFFFRDEAVRLLEGAGLEIMTAENKWANNWIIARKIIVELKMLCASASMEAYKQETNL